MGRAPCCDKANVKKGPWSPEEDAKLKSYIEKNGTGGNWIALPQKIGLRRCGKSCRLRWLNYLRPNIKHGGFTEDEDNLICSLYISIGSRWSIIAAQLPGRTDNDIKNYWNTRLKKKLLGKQRREQLARRETKKLGGENFLNNEFFSLCPQPPQLVVAPPLSVGFGIQDTRVRDNIISNNCLDMCQVEGTFSHDHDHDPDPSLNNKHVENPENYNYISDISFIQNQPLCKNSMIRLSPSTTCNYSFVNSSCLHPLMATDLVAINGVATNHSQEFDKIPLPAEIHEIMHIVPQDLVGLDSLSAVEMVNNTSSWGDVNCLAYTSNYNLSNSEVFQQKWQQDWTFLDDPRFLGYIQ